MDDDTDGDPHWSTGLSPPRSKWGAEGRKNEKGNKDCVGCYHPLIQGDGSNESSPTPFGLGLKEDVIQPDSLNVARFSECGWPGVFWKAIDNDTGTCFLCIYWILGIQSVWTLTFLDLEGGGRNLNFPQGRKPWLLLGMESEEEREWGAWEGVGRRGGNGNFYNLIEFTLKKYCKFKLSLFTTVT